MIASCCASALAAILFASGSFAAPAAYLIHRGDILELTVAGAPELQRRAPVNVDGMASFPLIGQIPVAGKSVPQILAAVRGSLPNKEFRRLAPDGHEYPVIISPDTISVAVAEYRPIYLNGDVSKPGELPYRPGLTVRQAIALGGGYDVMRLRMNNPFLEQADLRGQYQSQWTEFAKEQAHIARVKAELSNSPQLDRSGLTHLPLAADVVKQIVANASDLLSVHSDSYAKQKAYLATVLQQQSDRIATLTEQKQKEDAGTEVDQQDLDRLQGALKTGAVAIPRVVEGKRMLLYSSTRALQTAVQLALAVRQRTDAVRDLKKFDSDRRAQLLDELQTAEVNRDEIQSRLQALGEKLVYTDMVRSQLVNDTTDKPKLVIIRGGASGPQKTDATEETELEPGDVVEVSLSAAAVPAAARRPTD